MASTAFINNSGILKLITTSAECEPSIFAQR